MHAKLGLIVVHAKLENLIRTKTWKSNSKFIVVMEVRWTLIGFGLKTISMFEMAG